MSDRKSTGPRPWVPSTDEERIESAQRHPIPGQQELPLLPQPTTACKRYGCWPNRTTGDCNRCGRDIRDPE